MEVKGNVAVITGGASGLGEATARRLASLGAKIAIFDRDMDRANEIAAALEGKAFLCDVSDENSVEQALQALKKELGIPRICVNCAGIILAEKLLGKEGPMSLAHFRRVIDINLIGTFNMLRLLAVQMKDLPLQGEERGVMINTASIAAFEGQIGQAAYSASKGAVAALTLPIARELASLQIRVMAIAPGLFETPMMAELSEQVRTNLIANTVFPKRLGKPSEFTSLVVQIIENPMLNGDTLRLDGGVRLMAK